MHSICHVCGLSCAIQTCDIGRFQAQEFSSLSKMCCSHALIALCFGSFQSVSLTVVSKPGVEFVPVLPPVFAHATAAPSADAKQAVQDEDALASCALETKTASRQPLRCADVGRATTVQHRRTTRQ